MSFDYYASLAEMEACPKQGMSLLSLPALSINARFGAAAMGRRTMHVNAT